MPWRPAGPDLADKSEAMTAKVNFSSPPEATGEVAAPEPRPLTPWSEKVIWLCFIATSGQLAFLQPYIILAPGLRVNLFSGLLCLLTLTVALTLGGRGAVRIKSPEFLVSAALALLGLLSSLPSLTPLASFFRVAVLLASGLGGFWCARILLRTPENQRRFQWLCLVLLGGVLLVSLGEFFFNPMFHGYHHPRANMIFLLSFAPLSLLGRKSRSLVLLGVILLALSYAALCLSQRLSVVFIPLVLLGLGLLWGGRRRKYLLAALLVLAVIIGFFSPNILWFKLSKEYPAYRVENIFFSWSIAKQHPFLGIGLRSPREQFLENYRLNYLYETPEKFARDVSEIVTPDNLLLTLLTGLGFPFTIIYALSVLVLVALLIGVSRRSPPGLVLPPWTLLAPICLALAHWQFYDGLLFPQSSWFFHLLLGLIPVGTAAAAVQPAETGADLSFPPLKPNPDTGGVGRGPN
jgi:hypothetical protein